MKVIMASPAEFRIYPATLETIEITAHHDGYVTVNGLRVDAVDAEKVAEALKLAAVLIKGEIIIENEGGK